MTNPPDPGASKPVKPVPVPLVLVVVGTGILFLAVAWATAPEREPIPGWPQSTSHRRGPDPVSWAVKRGSENLGKDGTVGVAALVAMGCYALAGIVWFLERKGKDRGRAR